MVTRRKTTTFSKRKLASCTPVQLVAIIKQLQKKYASVAKSSSRTTTVRGKTPAQQCRAIQQQVYAVAKFLRSTTVKQMTARIKFLRAQLATTRVSPAIKRLTVKVRKIKACRTITKLMVLCKGFKATAYKNPKSYVVGKKKSTRKTKSTRTSRSARKSRKTKKSATVHTYSSWGSVKPRLVGRQVSNIVRFFHRPAHRKAS